MPFDWNDFLSLAQQLASNRDDASMRTAISRAYYCVYHLAFARAEKTAVRPPNGDRRHQWCWAQYTNTRDLECQRLGSAGVRLKRMREKADYDDSQNPRLGEEAQRMLEDARKFLSDLKALDAQYPRP